ncbi:uncharacterized protein LOC124647810 [Lolium rigidum]|uniref:uncharacterized protein LOC124647810 n=1 Tax=Lolium rigidum TaxID=89674 RepID=UPI001F5C4A2C|nr:uncharacterized protein LOC124647810 [Lolium rigidum]
MEDSDYFLYYFDWCVAIRKLFDEIMFANMLPGLSPPPSLVPSVSPAATQSSSIGASIAIIAVVIIATTLLTCCIGVLCRSSRHRRTSRSSFSRRSSSSPKASSAAASEMNAEVCVSGLELPVPSAPCLPEVEKLILELLSQPPVLVQPGSRMFCCICGQFFVPGDLIMALPVCSHKFHQSCVISRIRRPAAPSCCPFCDAPITIPCTDKTNLAPAYRSDQYDIEAQIMATPAPPGEEVAEAVGGSRGWLRSSLDRLSGSWRGCSSNHATAVVVPVPLQHTTRSWRLDNMGHLGTDSNGIQMQSGEEVEAVGGSQGWLRSYLATLSNTWSGRSDSPSSTVVLPLSSGRATESLSQVPSGCGGTGSWSRNWDLEAAEQRT